MSMIRAFSPADLRDGVRTSSVKAPEVALAELRVLRDEHPLWSSRLFEACRSGSLDRDDLRYIFAQYRLYSRSFTRFISALMANCDSDLFRARLTENLWEEGGGCVPEQRHAELFRRFLRDSLEIEVEDTVFDAHTQLFVREYLTFCIGSEPLAGSAFLSLGTEGIVGRMYEIFMTGLQRAGLRDDELDFFKIHIECDDDHALTLEQMMLFYATEPRWFEIAKRAMTHALDLRLQFFEHCVDELQRRRLDGMLARLNSGVSLCPLAAKASDIQHRGRDLGPPLYTNHVESAGIGFAVSRIPLQAEVLDPRRVAIAPGKCNERHRHAHETFIYILEGTGRVEVDAQSVDVVAGDSVMVPRWALHQTTNTGSSSLQFLAVTDYQLTKRAFVGDAQAYRLDETANLHRGE